VGSLAKGQNFQGPVTAQFTADGNAQQLPAVISISPVIETVGSHVTAQVTLVASGLGGLNIALTAKITGKVESWQTQANETVFTLAPGGSIVEKLTDSFGHHFTERAKPVGTPLTITVDLSGQFTLLEGTFISLKSRLGPGAPFDFLAYTA
jgi:hypothetical protein